MRHVLAWAVIASMFVVAGCARGGVSATGGDADAGTADGATADTIGVDDDAPLPDARIEPLNGPELRLTNQAAFSSNAFSNARAVVAQGSTIHALWFDEASKTGLEPDAGEGCFRCVMSAREIYYRRSLDAGLTWQPIVRVTNQAGISEFPAIAVSGSTVHAVWVDTRDGNREIYHARSIDSGATWSTEARLTTSTAMQGNPSIAASGGFVHVVWHDNRDGNREIYYKRSTTSGASWDPDARLTQTAGPGSVYPAVASSGSDVHVIWEEHVDGNPEIYYRRSTDDGAGWGTSVRLTTDAAQSFSPSVSVDGGRVHVAWHDNRTGTNAIFHKTSGDRGMTWTADARVSGPGALATFAQVAAGAGDRAAIVWMDERHGGRNLDIYLVRTVDGGATWSSEHRVSFDENRSTDPHVAISGSGAHVMWTDARDGFAAGTYDGNYEIYFRHVSL